MKVEFKHTTNFLGRNGMFKCAGLDLNLSTNRGELCVMIEPWTSKVAIGRCFIEIPVAEISQFVRQLKNVLEAVSQEVKYG